MTENHAPSVLPDCSTRDPLRVQPPTAEAPRTSLSSDFFFAGVVARGQTCAATRGGPGGETGAFVNDDDDDAALFERLLTLGAVRKNMSFWAPRVGRFGGARSRRDACVGPHPAGTGAARLLRAALLAGVLKES